MPIDYSKWDKLELSDDDDFECHPNVDKASFIRWKQADIHRKRDERRRKIEALKIEIANNEVFFGKLDAMQGRVEREGIQPFREVLAQHADTIKDLKARIEKEKKRAEKPPEEAYYDEDEDEASQQPPSPDGLLALLFDRINEEVKSASEDKLVGEVVAKLKEHHIKLRERQKDAKKELEKEERESHKKITMDDLHDGFSKSVINKTKVAESSRPSKSNQSKKVIEVLNPDAKMQPLEGQGQTSSSADNDDDDDIPEIETTDVSREFAKIKKYDESYKFISEHPELMNQNTVDQLLLEAFQEQQKGNASYAKQCVHQGWLIHYCHTLGKDGVRLFFQRITGPDPTAKTVFLRDVEETYQRMVERCKVLAAEKESKKNGVEQIQIEVTDPNSSLSVHIPDPNSTEPNERKRHEIFMTLPQELRDALQTSDLKVINKVLGKMSVEEAEQTLKVVGDCQVLTIEEGIIDTTKGETVPGREQDAQKADLEAVEDTGV